MTVTLDGAESLGIFCGSCAVMMGVPIMWVILVYNRFSRLRQVARESWSGVDVELKRRHDLVPNLVKTVQGYAQHERETLECVVAARAKAMAAVHAPTSGGEMQQRVDGERELGRSLGRLIALSERYPDLKGDRHFLELQRELALTEDRIAASRRFFNANVRELNALRVEFPSNLVGSAFGFRELRFFELEDAAERTARV